jgi:hypothetical protein
VLKRGLKFAPVPTTSNHVELTADIKSFSRRLRLNEFFFEKNYENESIFKKPSHFTPYPERDESLDQYCDFLQSLTDNLSSLPTEKQKDNLTVFERSALKELKDLVDSHRIVIMPADKGGAVVILDANHYKQMIEDVFQDPDYFEDSAGNQMTVILGKIASLCKKYKACLTTDEINYLTKFDCKEANLYGLPKPHKSLLIKAAIENQNSELIEIFSPQDLKIRPIIGGPASPTSHLSQLVDFLLKPFMIALPSHVRDSIDLLNQEKDWEKDPDSDYLLLTMDISAMYMNISETLGCKAISHFVTEKPQLLHPRFCLEFLIDAVLLILQNNVSYFDGNYKRQIHGCAMGSHKSPPYSSLAVGYLEKNLYERSRLTQGDEYADYLVRMLRRFLDDVFLKWRLSLGSPENLFALMNDLDPKIRFIMEKGRSLPFLDIRFELKPDNTLITDVFYKETDSHNYVPFFSFHPHKTLTNIPYTLARRLCTIVSEHSTLEHRLQELETFLRRKQYPHLLIKNGIERARAFERSYLLQVSEKSKDSEGIPFVFTHNCNNPQVLNSIHKSLEILAPSQRMQKVMKNKKIIAARRQPPNIKSILFRPRFDTSTASSRGSVLPCRKDPNKKKTGGQPCKCCDLLEECTQFQFSDSNEMFELRWHFTCETMNVCYALTCDGCGANYIGQTERSVRERNGEYRRAIADKKFTQGVHQHIFFCGKGVFSMTPFYKVQTRDRGHAMILSHEEFFIKKFDPKLNRLRLENKTKD